MNLGKDISTFAKETVVKATLKDTVNFLALGEQNINTQITNTKIELGEEFKETYGAIKSERTVIIANAEKILENMHKQFENNFVTTRDFENEGRE